MLPTLLLLRFAEHVGEYCFEHLEFGFHCSHTACGDDIVLYRNRAFSTSEKTMNYDIDMRDSLVVHI